MIKNYSCSKFFIHLTQGHTFSYKGKYEHPQYSQGHTTQLPQRFPEISLNPLRTDSC